jgi:hypothetical protein
MRGGSFNCIPLATGADSDVDGGSEAASAAFILFDSALGPERDPLLRAASAAAMTSLFPSPAGGDLLVVVGAGSEKNGSDIPPPADVVPSSVNWANGPPKCGEWLRGAVPVPDVNGFPPSPGNPAPLVAAGPSPIVKNGEIASPPGRSTEGVMAPPVAAKCCQGDMIGRDGG